MLATFLVIGVVMVLVSAALTFIPKTPIETFSDEPELDKPRTDDSLNNPEETDTRLFYSGQLAHSAAIVLAIVGSLLLWISLAWNQYYQSID